MAPREGYTGYNNCVNSYLFDHFYAKIPVTLMILPVSTKTGTRRSPN